MPQKKQNTESTPIYLGAVLAILGQALPAWAAEQTNETIAAILSAGGGIASGLGAIMSLAGALAYWLHSDAGDSEDE